MQTERYKEEIILDERLSKSARSISSNEEISFHHTDSSDKASANERHFSEIHKAHKKGDIIEVNEKFLFAAKKVRTHVNSIFDLLWQSKRSLYVHQGFFYVLEPPTYFGKKEYTIKSVTALTDIYKISFSNENREAIEIYTLKHFKEKELKLEEYKPTSAIKEYTVQRRNELILTLRTEVSRFGRKLEIEQN